MKKKKSIVTLILTPIILLALVGGLGYFFFNIVSSANESGNLMNGTWNVNGKEALVMDIENKTFSLDVNGVKESGKISNIKLEKDDSENSKLIYSVTFEGNDEFSANITVDFSKDQSDHKIFLEFESDKTSGKTEFVQIDKE